MDYVANLILKNDKTIFADAVAFDKIVGETKLKVALVVGIFETSPSEMAALLSFQPKHLASFRVVKLKADSYKNGVSEINRIWRDDIKTTKAYSIFNKSSTLNAERIAFVQRFIVSGQKLGVSGLNIVSKQKKTYYSCHTIHDYGQNMNCYLFSGAVAIPNPQSEKDVFFYEKPLYEYNPEVDDISFILVNKSSFAQTVKESQDLDLVGESKIKFAVNAIAKTQFDRRWKDKKICLLGYFGFWTAYAEIAFQTFYCLKRMGFTVETVSLNGFSSVITTDAEIQNSFVTPANVSADILLAITPANIPTVLGKIGLDHKKFKKKILLTMWETTKINRDFVDGVNLTYDHLLVPSQWCIGSFKKSGIRTPMLHQPLGSNEFLYRPQARGHDAYTFVTAGRLAHGGVRKGVEDVLRAFYLAFPKNEKVSLKVKIYPDDVIGEDLSIIFKDKRIKLMKEVLRPAEFAKYLAASDCYVSGSRSEGWGFIQQQAAMVGKPIISIHYSGLTEFLKPSDNFFMPHTETESSEFIYEKEGSWGDYRIEDMAQKMQEAASNPERSFMKGAMNSLNAGKYNFTYYYFQLADNLTTINV